MRVGTKIFVSAFPLVQEILAQLDLVLLFLVGKFALFIFLALALNEIAADCLTIQGLTKELFDVFFRADVDFARRLFIGENAIQNGLYIHFYIIINRLYDPISWNLKQAEAQH
jgi:hypothetical protein